jgi:hypothetical protein
MAYCAAFMLFAAGGAAAPALRRGARLGWGRRLLLGIGLLVAWRTASFPAMVLSGFVAALGEWLLRMLHPGCATVFPIFLLAVAGIAAFCAFLAGKLLQPRAAGGPGPLGRSAVAGGAALGLAASATISFSTRADWVPWPAFPVAVAPAPLHAPRANPYRPGRIERLTPAQRFLMHNARLTYDLVPASPWARALQGTLEAMVRRQPRAGSQQRIREHFAAYLAAHDRIGQ